jgi:hypothetical protein
VAALAGIRRERRGELGREDRVAAGTEAERGEGRGGGSTAAGGIGRWLIW